MSATVTRGSGLTRIDTGITVLDELIGALAAAGRLDVELAVAAGQVEAEVEDAGAAFGTAIGALLESGAHGYGAVPTDEALASVALEVSGRPAVYSNADLSGAGGLGTDLVARFLEPLATVAGLTLHVRLVEGEETRHVQEAIFKSLGSALAQACRAREET